MSCHILFKCSNLNFYIPLLIELNENFIIALLLGCNVYYVIPPKFEGKKKSLLENKE